MKTILIALSLSFATQAILAQKILTGIVRDEKGILLQGVSVTATDNTGNILTYSLTDSQGKYTLTLSGRISSVTFSHICYTKRVIPAEQTDSCREVILQPAVVALEEVTVRPATIRAHGDTITYRLGKFTRKEDRFLSDVLPRLPGFSVGQDGAIHYQGKAVSHVYVENMDITGGRYSKLINNLRANDIRGVQVMERHQHIKSLQDVSLSERAALNLQLSDSTKGIHRLVGQWTAGASADKKNDIIGQLSATHYHFTSSHQQMNIYKNDYTGHELTAEMNNFTENGKGIASSMLQDLTPNLPAISRSSYTFNKSHLASTDNIWKHSATATVRLHGGIGNNVADYRQYSITRYYLADPVTIDVQQNSNTRLRHSEVSFDCQYENNDNDIYTKNLFQVYGDFDHQTAAIQRNTTLLHEDLKPRQYYIREVINTVRAVKGGKLLFDGNITFNHLPGKVLAEGSRKLGVTQDIMDGSLSLSYSHRLEALNQTWGLVAAQQTGLYTFSEGEQCTTERYTIGNYSLLSLMTYRGNSIRCSLTIPVRLCRQTLADTLQSSRLLVNPSLYVDYTLSPSLRSTLSASYEQHPWNYAEETEQQIVVSRLTSMKGAGRLSYSRHFNINIGIQYRNVLKQLFGNIVITNALSGHLPMYERQWLPDGAIAFNTSDMTGERRKNAIAVELSKNFQAAAAYLSVAMQAERSQYQQLQDKKVMSCKDIGYAFTIDGNWSPLTWWSLQGKYSYRQANREDETARKERYSSNSYSLTTHIFLGKWDLSCSVKSYHTHTTARHHATMADAILSYKMKRQEYILRITNLTNEHSYHSIEKASYYTSETITELRPREITVGMKFQL